MRDPVRHKNRAKVVMEVKYPDDGSITSLYLYIDKEIAKTIPADKFQEIMKGQLKLVNRKPGAQLLAMNTAFSYVDGSLKGFDFGNILVQVNLPYCLHVPDYYDMSVLIPEKNIEALISLNKVWTNRAETPEFSSDKVDILAEDYPIYYSKSTILSPQLPLQEEEGWDPHVTGVNLEKDNDRGAIFRYSKVDIQLKMDIPSNFEKLTDKQRDLIILEIRDKSTSIVNRLIDNYRDITKEKHVRRLGEIVMSIVYFIPQNMGYYTLSLPFGTAMINRSNTEIKLLSKSLSKGSKPDVYRLLLLDAQDSFDTKDYVLAIVASYQALEIFLENFLVSKYIAKGVSQTEYKAELIKHWRTKERLNLLLKKLTGSALNEQTEKWNKWALKYDKTRNEVIHTGREATTKETMETLEVNQEIINWILTL